VVALLVNPNNNYTTSTVPRVEEAARQRGVQLLVVRAGTESEVDAAFATMVQGHAGALVVQADPYLHSGTTSCSR
jgi:putative ABC transport system substrate-binding protein